jgi:hypothetical protein
VNCKKVKENNPLPFRGISAVLASKKLSEEKFFSLTLVFKDWSSNVV